MKFTTTLVQEDAQVYYFFQGLEASKWTFFFPTSSRKRMWQDVKVTS